MDIERSAKPVRVCYRYLFCAQFGWHHESKPHVPEVILRREAFLMARNDARVFFLILFEKHRRKQNDYAVSILSRAFTLGYKINRAKL